MSFERAQNTFDTTPRKFADKGEKLEGYYLKTVEETINGNAVLKHYFETTTGTVTVLGQKDLTSKLVGNNLKNCRVIITYDGIKKLSGGRTLKQYTVDFDRQDQYDAAAAPAAAGGGSNFDDDGDDDTDWDGDNSGSTVNTSVASKGHVPGPTASLQAKAEALLNKANGAGRNKLA